MLSRHAVAPASPAAPALLPASPPTEPVSAASSAGSSGPAGITAAVPSLREDQLLRRAHDVLESDPAAALARLDETAAAYPRGELAEEREFMAVQALQRLGRGAEARARGESLIARAPHGIYAQRVRRILAAP
jgi:hypothetical protein